MNTIEHGFNLHIERSGADVWNMGSSRPVWTNLRCQQQEILNVYVVETHICRFWPQQGRHASALVLSRHTKDVCWQHDNDIIMEGGLKFWVINQWEGSQYAALQWTRRTQTNSPSHCTIRLTRWDDDDNWRFATTTIDRGLTPVLSHTSASQELIGRTRVIPFQKLTPPQVL